MRVNLYIGAETNNLFDKASQSWFQPCTELPSGGLKYTKMKTLVICRIDGREKIPSWLFNLEEYASVVVSTYGATFRSGNHHFIGGKWIGVLDYFRQNPAALTEYDYFWFPDDDIETDGDTAASFLQLCADNKFELAQPALTPDSYFAYRETIQNPQFQFRKTNFVELMMPLMRRDFLIKVLPLLEDKHAALGVDWIWQTLAEAPRRNVAIIDRYPMRHGRPRNTNLKARMTSQGVDLLAERAETFARYNIKPLQPVTFSARLRNGRDIVHPLRISLSLCIGYTRVRSAIRHGSWPGLFPLKLAWRNIWMHGA